MDKQDIVEVINLKYKEQKILFAVESGSRVWGFPSADSDYDIRGVHYGNVGDYLSLDEPPAQIEHQITLDGTKLDIVTWDIKKFANLLMKSNPSVSEWIQSPIQYIGENYTLINLRFIFGSGFSALALKKHYIGLARQNYFKYIANNERVNYKKYIYILRALACVNYIENRNKPPPLDYHDLLNYMPLHVGEFMVDMVKMKMAREDYIDFHAPLVEDYVQEDFAKIFEEGSTEGSFNKEQMNDMVANIIKEGEMR